MLWTEKYRPKILDEIIGQDKFVADATHWDGANTTMPNVILYGVAGVGKTAAAHVLANRLLGDNKKSNFFEINASDDRKLETVRTTIKDIAMSMKIGDVPHKIILLDEMDGMTPDAQNALKRVMERYSHNCRFIITCNRRHKIIPPLQSRCANYHFTRLSDADVKEVLVSVLKREGQTTPDSSDFDTFISSLQGDIRRGLTELQASVNSSTPIKILIERTHAPYKEIMSLVLNKDYNKALDTMHKLVYLSVDMKVICQSLHDTVIDMNDLDNGQKFKYLRVIGEAEWRSNSMTPKILSSWMIGQMI
jgi:replication factor C small subunit